MKAAFIALFLPLAIIAGCAVAPPTVSDPEEYSQPTVFMATVPPGDIRDDDSELMLLVLIAEMAAQLRDYPLAAERMLEAAMLASDPAVAERALRMSLVARDYLRAMEAAERWLVLDPEDTEALQLAALLEVNAGRTALAVERLQVLTRAINQDDVAVLVIQLLAQGEHWDRILETVALWTRLYPDNPTAWHVHAELALRGEAYRQARDTARRGLERFPGLVPLRLVLARALIELDDSDAALEAFRAAVEASPERRDVRLAYARALVDLQDFSRVLPEFERLLAGANDDPDLLLTVALLSLEAYEFDLARIYLRRLLDAGVRLDDANYYLGRLEEEAGEFASARAYYRSVVGGEHRNDALLREARLTAATEGVLSAAPAYTRLQAHEDRGLALAAYLSEAGQLRENGEFTRALQRLERGLIEFANSPQLLYLRGIVHENIGDIPAAEADFRAILVVDPENVSALNALGYTLADHTERYDEAYDLILRALALRPDDAAVIDSHGWVLFRLGRFEEALNELERAYELMPDAEIASNLAVVLWELGRQEEARRIVDEALAREPEHARLLRVQMRLFP
jgi:tetratricopeptide (TPR) repeat protein